MPKTPGKMHMYDMVKIDTIVFEFVGGGGLLTPPPPGTLAVWNSPDRIGLMHPKQDVCILMVPDCKHMELLNSWVRQLIL